MVDVKGKGRATEQDTSVLEEQHWGPLRESDRWTIAGEWKASRRRAKADKRSWDYVLSSGAAGGIAGCVAKTAIAPLDRVKILFQTSNPEFQKYAGSPMGLIHASGRILRTSGVRGLFQGHSATLLRIFPYAGVKFMTYDWAESVLIPTPEDRTPGRFFVAGAISGVTSVLFTYPLELIRVRLAFQTRDAERTTLREAIRSIYHESQLPANTSATSSISSFTRSIPLYPFYRGFSVSLIGMIPYAGVSFLTYGTLKRYVGTWFPLLEQRKTVKDLGCGAIAGAVSQTASYPFEVIRRRMQVGGVAKTGGVSWRDAINGIRATKGWRGFFVGLSIGYLKVIPMTSISFATWQLMKRVMEI